MALDLGPIEINCDAPPYSIIQACRRVGVQRPEDVRWCRITHFLNGEGSGDEPANVQAWKVFLGMSKARKMACSCGHKMPLMEKCTFTFITGREVSYFIGQCNRCLTVFWDEV